MNFYVRLLLPNNKTALLLALSDLNQKIGSYLASAIAELKHDGEKSLATELERALSANKMTCWKKPCDKDMKFLKLMSKVEKIEGKESDVFEIKFI